MTLKEYIYPILAANGNLPEFATGLYYSFLPKNFTVGTATTYETNKNNSFSAMNCNNYAYEHRMRFKVMSDNAKTRDDLGNRIITEMNGMEDAFLRQITFVTDDSFFNEFTDWYEWTIDFNIYIDN